MSRDVVIMRVPAGTRHFHALPETFEHVLGTRAEVRAIIAAASRQIRFRDSRWGELRGEDFLVHIDLGEREPCRSVMLHIDGDVAASFSFMRALCSGRPWAALDLAEVDFVDFDDAQSFVESDVDPAPESTRRRS